ncbi:helix-turn-helix domain-containing protein [Haliangium sp.]|uniref:helix-turn-helix domain-containing protein n=1 Tax=Haliangium sp. TaxID=2663208 RepID=UPI003D0EBA4F
MKKLTLDEAASHLGISVRQVRYRIDKGRLKATKQDNRYYIAEADLPMSEARVHDQARRERQMQAAVRDGLAAPEPAGRFSARTLKAIQIAQPLRRRLGELVGPEHEATRAIRRAITHLGRGGHRYRYDLKAACYRDARDEASLAVTELLMSDRDDVDALVDTIEQELMPALAGLLRRLDKKLA